ncbi:MAG: hypothetical protein K2J20_02460, partial [Bacilli bacterium]|nr:hypothetical protein [Bacilli bacterium]
NIAKESFYSKNETEEDKSGKLGFIPIYNERFVFINDTIDSGAQSIVLYDLKNHKTLSKYLSVDAGAYTGEEKVSFKITEGVYIMAQSKNSNNKYGLIKINNDSVTSVIKFDYDSIEKLKEYYMVKESGGTYLLLDKMGEEQSGHFGYKIVNYLGAYFKVLNPSDNKYGVLDNEGNKVSELSYLDITLKDSYFVAVNTNKALEIYKYDDNSFKLHTPIPLSENYKNDYEVSAIAEGFVVKVKSTCNTINIDKDGYQPGENTPVVSEPENPDVTDEPGDNQGDNDTNSEE